jgi:RHS repeat-associated protein
MLFDGRNTLVYDYSNRPVRIENETYLVEIKYDALGRRIEKKVTTKATLEVESEQYIYDGVRIIEDRDELGNLKAEYIYGNGIDEVLMMKRGGRTVYYHDNALGSITHLSNEKGAIEESYKYEAYGRVTIYDERGKEKNKSRFKNRYLFTGREYDSETGLYYYRARYYSPSMGRFINRDPATDDNLKNLYAYVDNNPINFNDPFGLKAKKPATSEGLSDKVIKAICSVWWLRKIKEILGITPPPPTTPPAPTPPIPTPPPSPTLPKECVSVRGPLVTYENVAKLATVLQSEASQGDPNANSTERTWVGWTVRNRMAKKKTDKVADVTEPPAYANDQPAKPCDKYWKLASEILAADIKQDPTGGATHFYSPRYMKPPGRVPNWAKNQEKNRVGKDNPNIRDNSPYSSY